uniref:Uncharacterized protein n=1 Tax=Mycena chlorophos TaxID=658473 RepID=A0ABQ0L893_MYCCL|nr:predicted protein [Mycena chlorophos]
MGGPSPVRSDALTELYSAASASPASTNTDSFEQHVHLLASKAGLVSGDSGLGSSELGVSIGPLEYCGNGYIIRDGGNVVHVALCRGDPNIPLRLEERRVLSDNRITAKLDAPGQLKRARTEKENTAVATGARGWLQARRDAGNCVSAGGGWTAEEEAQVY